jgi:hypothetical protein
MNSMVEEHLEGARNEGALTATSLTCNGKALPFHRVHEES